MAQRVTHINGAGSNRIDYEKIYRDIAYRYPHLRPLLEKAKNTRHSKRMLDALFMTRQMTPKAREELFYHYLKLALKEAVYYSRTYLLEFEDVWQTCSETLLLCIDEFNPEKYETIRFANYFSFRCIRKISREYFSHTLNGLRIPSGFSQEYMTLLEAARKHFAIEDPAEFRRLIRNGGIDRDGLYAFAENTPVKYDPVADYIRDMFFVFEDNETVPEKSAAEPFIGDVSDSMDEETFYQKELEDIVPCKNLAFTERQILVLKLMYGFGMDTAYTLDETGKTLGVTRERIRQILAKATRKIKQYFYTKDCHCVSDYLDGQPGRPVKPPSKKGGNR